MTELNMDHLLIEAVADYAHAKGLDPDAASEHMRAALALMNLPKSIHQQNYEAYCLRISKWYR